MIISVASGKGGTGKTTVATNLAASLGFPVRLLDCDVEEPNAHIFLKPESVSQETVGTFVPDADLSRCEACGACRDICQFSAITLLGDTVMVFPEMCHGCKGCMMVCPTGAIRESSRELGTISKGLSGRVELVHGLLRVGEAMSPPLIKKVKQSAGNGMPIIIDAPPGTSCPVIEAIRGTDYVILVTEPTPFGLNDLMLAAEAVRILGIPFGLIINRCDAGDGNTLEHARRENIPILAEIPDRREIAQAYSKGILMTEVFPEMKTLFRSVFEKIKAQIGK